MKQIPVDNDKFALVDDEDYLIALLHGPWYLDKDGYAYNTKHLYLHKLIAKLIDLKGMIDHRDRNSLNNRRNNLRETTKSQNAANSKLPKNNTTGYKGVWQKPSGKFEACIKVNNKTLHLGTYLFEEEAAKIYDEAAIYYFGEFAALNFPKILIQYSKNNYDCLALAFAIVLNVPLNELIKELGNDGSEIIFPALKEPMCRRGNHPQEFLTSCLCRGFYMLSIEARPVMAGDPEFKYTKELDNTKFLYESMKFFNGVLCGETEDGRYHAVAWSKEGISYNGSLKSINYFYALAERKL